MKLKLTPSLAYLIGLWKKRKTKEGAGVKGGEELLSVFARYAIQLGLTTPDKLLTADNKAYFYHARIRRFFQEVEKNALERFKYLNEYAANYVAGMFDGAGFVDKAGRIFIKGDEKDELLLYRLGFKTERKKEGILIKNPKLFLSFIIHYT